MFFYLNLYFDKYLPKRCFSGQVLQSIGNTFQILFNPMNYIQKLSDHISANGLNIEEKGTVGFVDE